jgi:hypothetical protein
MAKQTPIPDTIKIMGIRQRLIISMKIHSPSRDCLFWIKKMYMAQGEDPHPVNVIPSH